MMSEHFTRGYSATPKNPEGWSFFDPPEEFNASRGDFFSLHPGGLMPLEAWFASGGPPISQVPREHHLFSNSRGTHTSEVTAPSHILQRIRSRPLPRDEIPLERVFYPRQDENLDGGFF